MRRKLLNVVTTVVGGAALAMMGSVLVGRGDTAAAQGAGTNRAQVPGLTGVELDTSSPNWKLLTDDVGVMIRKDERLGLRARLFVRVNDAWQPVAADGLADVLGTVPAK